MSPSPNSHICWGKEPWFAWDLWNEVSGAHDQFQLLLNGGFALAPSLVSITYADGMENSFVLPSVVEMEPAIGDYKPVMEYHGIWHYWATGQDTVVFYHNEHGAEMDAQVMPHVWMAQPVEGLGQGHFYRPWNVLPLPDASQDNLNEFDEADNWLRDNVENFRDGDRFSIDGLDAIYVEHEKHLDVQRRAWHAALTGMAPRHACAELMLQELEQEMRLP